MITSRASPGEKIGLFRSLFRGREDVFARRFESHYTGRSGYSPACGNEWVRGICDKGRVRCADCPHRDLLPVTDEVIRSHLTGHDAAGVPFVMGIYPMLLDETCFFLAIDLDGDVWQDDARALAETCRRLQLPVALERSRSGTGGHLWFFFTQAVPACLARKLGTHLITETMERRPELGLGSYDRLFPNQDTLPRGGFGNVIALPLQKFARDNGNSAFLDRCLQPFRDQWHFLSELPRISSTGLRRLVAAAGDEGNVLGVRPVPDDEGRRMPWSGVPSRRKARHLPGSMPEKISAVLSDQLYIPKGDLPPSLHNCLLRLAAFQNPEFYRAQTMRLPTRSKPRVIACAEEFPDHIGLPRGCLSEVRKVLRLNGVRFRVKDRRFLGAAIKVQFRGELRDDQKRAMSDLLPHDCGVLSATTAFGKTVLAAAMIAERGVNTLVLVHRRQLMEQWVERLTGFLDIENSDIGRLGGGRRKLKGMVDIALLQSVVRKGIVDDRVRDYGHIIVDECHHISARNFELAVRRARARYILGLSATVTRKDGHHPIIFMQCGPVRHQIGAREHVGTREMAKQVIVRPTLHRSVAVDTKPQQFTQLMDCLAHDPQRNATICDDVRSAVDGGAFPLILTERTEHLELLAAGLDLRGLRVIRFHGKLNRNDLQEAKNTVINDESRRSRTGNPGSGKRQPEACARGSQWRHCIDCGGTARGPVVIATGRFAGEGFDVPRLDTLFLAMPISWKGTIAQYVGRLHRLHEGKTIVRVFDYADLEVPVLARMFDRRCKAYRQQGYTIMLPAGAIPGWPPEVPLPIDEKWKQAHSASVRRLVQDGVDVPLAELFVGVTGIERLEGRKGEDRARSASEAFLFKRLETLPQTEGRFDLNTQLPIAFRGCAGMEVDFVDPKSRLVIELDGAQHFGDLEAYRRDHEKDYLLQENNYCVLRFLAEDLGPHLDTILNTILRALSHQQKKPQLPISGESRQN